MRREEIASTLAILTVATDEDLADSRTKLQIAADNTHWADREFRWLGEAVGLIDDEIARRQSSSDVQRLNR